MSVLLSGGPIKIFRCVNPSFAPPADNFAKDWRRTQTDIPNSHQSFLKLQWLNHNGILHGDALACAQCHHDQTHRFLNNGVYMKGFYTGYLVKHGPSFPEDCIVFSQQRRAGQCATILFWDPVY